MYWAALGALGMVFDVCCCWVLGGWFECLSGCDLVDPGEYCSALCSGLPGASVVAEAGGDDDWCSAGWEGDCEATDSAGCVCGVLGFGSAFGVLC